tara:strand:+ start:490 stop:2037 length:1548 start_codon:yes stop_codon:yes gene_type:complete
MSRYVAPPPSSSNSNRTRNIRRGKINLSTPIDTKTTSITYSQADNNLLLDVGDSSESASKGAQIKAVKVRNDGYVVANAIFAYTRWAAEDDTSEAVNYVHYILNPDEEIILPASRAIISPDNQLYDGTAITATAPNSNMYVDSTADLDSATDNAVTSDATVTTLYLEDGHTKFFRVGDLIRIDNEIIEVVALGTGADLANSTMTVVRGSHGSTAATHNDDRAIRLPFFNNYHNFDKYSVSQTDDFGRFKSTNFFGYGRTSSGRFGVTAGSVALQFYESGYQGIGLTDLTSNTESGLVASTAYELDITVDGGTTFSNLSFTVDSSNTKFGGSNGIISKIQAALDAQYYTAGNLFEKKVSVGIEGGDLIFRSGSNLSTSAIALGAGSTGTAEFFGTGRIPAAPAAATAVAARLSTEQVFDPITNSSTYKEVFLRDDGRGNLIWKNQDLVGTINYETGALDFTIPEKPNAEFVLSVLHTSPFSGKINSSDADRGNSLKQVLGNTPQQKCEAVLTVETF